MSCHIQPMTAKTPKQPKDAIGSWDDEGGAPGSGDASVRNRPKRRGRSPRLPKASDAHGKTTTMGDRPDDVHERAEAQFKQRERPTQEVDTSRAEQATAAKAIDDKMARLKSLRLGKEAADKADADARKKVATHAKKPSTRYPGR
jgi:hypothetical protein